MCGIFGIANHAEASRLTYLGLYALQHRGQESTGIATSDQEQVYLHKSMGHVADVYDEDTLARLKGSNAIGHTRYSTAGDSTEAPTLGFTAAASRSPNIPIGAGDAVM